MNTGPPARGRLEMCWAGNFFIVCPVVWLDLEIFQFFSVFQFYHFPGWLS
jgi:hypothetical protein